MESEWNIQLDGTFPYWAFIQHNCDGKRVFEEVCHDNNGHLMDETLRLIYLGVVENEYKPSTRVCPQCNRPAPKAILMQAELLLQIKNEGV